MTIQGLNPMHKSVEVHLTNTSNVINGMGWRSPLGCKGADYKAAWDCGVRLDLTNLPQNFFLHLQVVPKYSLWGYFQIIIAAMKTEMMLGWGDNNGFFKKF